VVTVVSPQSYGQSAWMVRIQARPESVRSLSRALADRDDVAWVTIGAGGTEIAASLLSRSAVERDHLLLDRLPRQAQVLGFTVHSQLHRFVGAGGVEWTVQSPLVGAESERALLAGSRLEPSTATPDAADSELVSALTEDGRVTMAELAQRTGWSEARAARRMAALLGSGALYLDVDVAQEVFGFTTTANIWLTIEPAHLHDVGQALVALPEIAYCAAITGAVNLMAVGLFRSDPELYAFLTERIGALPGVRQAEVSPVVQKVKQAGSFVEDQRLTSAPARRPTR
jgi:DNA-binding Lrp family transcriptional regulator